MPITRMLFRIVRISCSVFKCNYLKNENHFLSFLCRLSNLHQILNIIKKKMVVRANVFRKLQNVKDLFRLLTKKRCFRRSFDTQHVKGSQTIVKSLWERFYHIFPPPWGEIIWKISLLSKFEMIWVFVNTWTADYKYPVQDCGNFTFPFHIQIS